MSDDSILYINMLGECYLQYNDVILDDKVIRSKKIWTLLEYLITFRDKGISQNELIELLYPEDKSDNPINALKTLLHRVRTTLDQLGYVAGKQMIIQRRGSYTWNDALDFEVDIDVFIAQCELANDTSLDRERRLEAYLTAIEIYKGDFLAKSALESWVVPINTYYHTLYLRIVHEVIELLQEDERHQDIIHVCQRAITIDPYDEFCYYNLFLSLIALKQYQTALTQYENMTNLFYREFGVTPSKQLQGLYKQLIQSNNTIETDLNVIKEELREDDCDNGAFFCEYVLFKDMYQLRVRAAARNGVPIFIGLVTVNNPSTEQALNTKKMNSIMNKLSDTIKSSLRRSDVYARYSVCQYILMLPTASYESCEMVFDRIVKSFRRDNPRSQAYATYSFQAIESMM